MDEKNLRGIRFEKIIGKQKSKGIVDTSGNDYEYSRYYSVWGSGFK